MKKTVLYIAWAVLYCACLGCSFISGPGAVGKGFLVALSVLFFVPPFYLAWRAKKEENRKALLTLRWISGGVLALSVVLLALNFLSVYFSAKTGLVLYVLLAMVSVPMFCIQYWVLGLFLWASLLMFTLQKQCPCQM